MLEIKNVSVSFAGTPVKAVDDVSLTLEDGTKTAIVGETGSGKSVLLVAIIRLLPSNAVVDGQILLDGEDILTIDKDTLCQIRGGKISYVPQGGGGSLNPLLTIGYQVAEPLMIHRGVEKKSAIDLIIPLLEKFNLVPGADRAKDYPHQYSGGMRQRAMVAMGISAGSRIILADEPTKGLDDTRVKMVIDAFDKLEKETLLCVTHDIIFAQAISKKLCVMYAATQLEYGDTEEVMTNPLHPYTRDLINAMPENGMKYDDHGFSSPEYLLKYLIYKNSA